MESCQILWTAREMDGTDALAPFDPHPSTRLLPLQCPSCGGSLASGALVSLALGPGRDPSARAAQQQGERYYARAIVCHEDCLTPRGSVSAAVHSAEALIRRSAEAAEEWDMPRDLSPSEGLLSIADSLRSVSDDLARWEELTA